MQEFICLRNSWVANEISSVEFFQGWLLEVPMGWRQNRLVEKMIPHSINQNFEQRRVRNITEMVPGCEEDLESHGDGDSSFSEDWTLEYQKGLWWGSGVYI